jgi:hypothetical protein
MARPSKLSPEQWGEVATISKRGVSQQSERVKTVAKQLAVAQSALAELPLTQQHIAVSLADKLRNISSNMAVAAEHGSVTASALHGIARRQAEKIIVALEENPEADPMDHQDKLQAIAGLTKIGNDAGALAMGLMSANKGAPPPGEDPIKTLDNEALEARISALKAKIDNAG